MVKTEFSPDLAQTWSVVAFWPPIKIGRLELPFFSFFDPSLALKWGQTGPNKVKTLGPKTLPQDKFQTNRMKTVKEGDIVDDDDSEVVALHSPAIKES